MRKETFNLSQVDSIKGKTNWLGIEQAIRAVIFDVAQNENDALDGIRLISDILGRGTGRGYPFGDAKQGIE